MRVALFVEGSHTPPVPRQKEALNQIWSVHLPSLAKVRSFSNVFHISKQNIEQLDSRRLRASGVGESLDEIIARHLRWNDGAFDAAVVAWDSLPGLKCCRACSLRVS
jgi:hypothetical protein